MSPQALHRHWLHRQGLSLAVHDQGGSGRPFVFQHGLCGNVAQTAEACPDGEGLRLITLECRGHGESAAGDLAALSIATFSDDLAAVIEQSAQGPVDVGGISMGAAIALRLAVTRADLVRSLVLVRPAWVTDAAPANMHPNLAAGQALARMPADQALAAFEASATARALAREAPDNLASLRGFFSREPLAVTAALLQAISLDGPGVSPQQLARLAVPVTLVGHAQDAIHPWAHVQQLALLMPHASCIEITPKAVSKAAYLHDLHAAIARHFRSLTP